METNSIIINLVLITLVAIVCFAAGRIYQWIITPNPTDKSQTPLTTEEEGQL